MLHRYSHSASLIPVKLVLAEVDLDHLFCCDGLLGGTMNRNPSTLNPNSVANREGRKRLLLAAEYLRPALPFLSFEVQIVTP
jgi:hypothetical protein